MTTLWDNTANEKRAQLVGHLNDVPATIDAMSAKGLTPDQAVGQIERMVQVQAVMLATNHLFLVSMLLFIFAASIVWISPRPRAAPPPGGGH
ncbi:MULTISPECIES: hypothetical protein [Polyangium]|uniref:Uncharacterized protein n=1 Tax=Polyangium jinanense TaxID=2829994 RepID=A0A9X3X882_9BACT|nr:MULTISPECIES: hypothetical protein [Polyangium]MDC3955802.1 hypothetical protein [Polyangium jinanense]MDC3983161.1 hypothetical protein [Polyangium jinanense]MDI3290755.1 hypothetical protein [Polyangium sp. 15x6]